MRGRGGGGIECMYCRCICRCLLDILGELELWVELAAVAGMFVAAIGMMGWAALAGSRVRLLLALGAFLYPAVVMALGIATVGAKEPGVVLYGAIALAFPAWIPAIILAAMALSNGRKSRH